VKTVFLPKGNAPDLKEVPEETRKALDVRLLERAEEVLEAALLPARRTSRGPRRAPGRGKRKRG
jgi:ATP-dependent Lon protease